MIRDNPRQQHHNL